MPVGELYINGMDAFTEYGMSMESSALSSLMTPPPSKEFIENKSRQENGKRVVTCNPMVDERELSLQFHIKANGKSDFMAKYSKLCDVLANGTLEISTSYQQGVVYRMIYVSCTQFSEYRLGMAKFTLRLNEPNPCNRNI